ncbi:putative lipid II flippase FtsW [Candidatus Poribacteria bacterium]|nr:putative lipid II flippase FtsW [Candidatus Poribacteria bacterium]MYA99842.1 putative lipid II flippase FtsW [Candidatus Poribacteria bacterium]
MLRNYQNSPRSKRNFKSKRKARPWWTNTRTYSADADSQEQVKEPLPEQNSGRMDTVLIAITFCLIAIGILMVYSSSHLLSSRHYDGYSYRYLQIHIIACMIGLVGMFMIAYVPYRFYGKYANLLLVLSFVGLLLVFVPSLSVSVQGAEGGRFKRWINIGLPINFQPVEFAKIALVIHIANFISRNPERIRNFFNGVLPNILIVAAAFGLVVSQPDFGSAFLLVVAVGIVLFIGGMRIWHVLMLAGVGGGLLSLLVIRDPYRLKRIMDYFAMLRSPDAANYHLTRSLDALEGGGLLGMGIDSSLQKISRLPYPHTDFIFAVLGEEFGFVGATAVTLIFMLFVWRGLHIARYASNLFGSLLATGITTMIGLQAFINIGVVTGLLPTKGITLPFISYGGSSIVLSLVSVGILLNISRGSNRGTD